jgi:hypothetical protein
MARKMRIVLEVVVDDEEVGEGAPIRDFQVHYLLADALTEFQHPRRHPEEYVAKRYPEGEGYGWLKRDKKIAEVAARVALAEKLRCAALGGEPTFEPCCPDCGATGTPKPHSECEECEAAYQDMMQEADDQMGDKTP